MLDLFVGNKLLRTVLWPLQRQFAQGSAKKQLHAAFNRLVLSLCMFEGFDNPTLLVAVIYLGGSLHLGTVPRLLSSPAFRTQYTFSHRNSGRKASWIVDKNRSDPNVAEILYICS